MHRQTACRVLILSLCLAVIGFAPAAGQGDRPASPEGAASTQIGDAWIDITYSRPILRGRNGIFGSGEEYGQTLLAGGPVWRAGANVTTRINTEADLMIGGSTVPAGEYSLFIDLKDGAWTAIISRQPYMEAFDRAKMAEGLTWGAYGYNADHDVVRAPMMTSTQEFSIDQMTILFSGVSDAGGAIVVMWDTQMGVLPFSVGQ
ncbi:MAG: DUF2911 domain-containing protein [Holophagales bacterium]|nr:DUF2911 domain-containing protein [Holophagales bacterium]MYC10390.1 DUF2911 domain-containing protein [Holophagales bacterium]